MTQFRTGEGWLYLAAGLDLWSRRVTGWAMSSAVSAGLVGDTLVMAFQRRLQYLVFTRRLPPVTGWAQSVAEQGAK